MNRKVTGILANLLVVTILALLVSSVSAYNDKFVDVSGTVYVETQAAQYPRFAGESGNLIIECVGGNVEWRGHINGDASYTGSRWVKSKNAVVAYNIYTFDVVTVDGKTGSMRIEMTFVNKGMLIGRWRIMGGTGELAGIHGQGTFSFMAGYSGQVHFDP